MGCKTKKMADGGEVGGKKPKPPAQTPAKTRTEGGTSGVTGRDFGKKRA
jgi:hypothetical protein